MSDLEMAGKPLADGMRALILCVKGDLDHVAKSWKLRHYNADELCDLCPANRQESNREMLYNNFSSDAKWPGMQYSEKDWRALYSGHFLHWIFWLVGVSNLSIEPDELHVWHLACLHYFLGSVLALLTHYIMGGTPTENMKKYGTVYAIITVITGLRLSIQTLIFLLLHLRAKC